MAEAQVQVGDTAGARATAARGTAADPGGTCTELQRTVAELGPSPLDAAAAEPTSAAAAAAVEPPESTPERSAPGQLAGADAVAPGEQVDCEACAKPTPVPAAATRWGCHMDRMLRIIGGGALALSKHGRARLSG